MLSVLYHVRPLGKRLKQWHGPTYHVTKWTLLSWLSISAVA